LCLPVVEITGRRHLQDKYPDMKIKLLSATFILTFSLTALYAQDSLKEARVKAIKTIVAETDSTTSLIPVEVDIIRRDSLSKSGVNALVDSLAPLRAYFKDKKLKKLRLDFGFSFHYGGSRDYYYDDGELVYVFESVMNSTRMGSCGTLQIDSYYFLQDNKIIECGIMEKPFECYNTPVKNEADLFGELAMLLRRLEAHLKNNIQN